MYNAPSSKNFSLTCASTPRVLNNKKVYPARVHCLDGDILNRYTYKELNEVSNRVARVLCDTIRNNNLARNNDEDYIIAVSMQPSDKLVITLLAIWKCGAAYLPLDPSFPKPRVEHIIQESKPALIIYEEASSALLDTKGFTYDILLELSSNYSNSNLSDNESLEQIKDDLAIVLYTSGSTGVPKGKRCINIHLRVRLPHKVILNRLQWQFKTFPYSVTEKVGVFKTSLTFVDSVSEIWGPLLNGLAILVVRKAITQDPEKLVILLEKYKIERLVLVPSLLRSLLMYLQLQVPNVLQKRKDALSCLKLWVCSGETLVVSLAKEFYKYFPENEYKLCNFYGSTEIMGDVTYHVITGMDQLRHQDKVPIGLPIDNTIIYILDSNYRPVKTGEVGELFASGQNVAAGYVNGRDPEKFVENPLAIDPLFAKLYRTGDFAKLEKGTVFYEGRTDSQIKIRGHRVDLSEIEKAVTSIDGIEKAIVLCYQPGEINQALLAFVLTETAITEHQIEEALRKKLTSYMVPQVIILDSIPLLVNGKIDRQSLLKTYGNVNNNDISFQNGIDYKGVPKDQMHAAVALFETVASVLGKGARSTISIDANFYNIGGNSLNSIFTITALSERGYHISKKNAYLNGEAEHVYTSELLKDEYKEDVLDMITTSFYEKADLEQWLMPNIYVEDYRELVDAIWEPLVDKRLSLIVRAKNGDIHGVALNFDARDEPEVEIKSQLNIVFEFLESIEGPVRDNILPPGKGKVLHSFMMATRSTLTPAENVSIMNFMEDEVLKLAIERQFAGIFTTNTSPLTQQLGSDVYAYQTIHDCQVNLYVATDSTKPFGKAPDSQRAKVQWKPV
ncbi:ebony [Holotrichia oblita]|uniref:Ebony n=1 Tax=Holotrichia oblita TaxID=644536 RepID=A0ACB9T2Q4_HOLOL|nr:ebony [Holotrichia oblita]